MTEPDESSIQRGFFSAKAVVERLMSTDKRCRNDDNHLILEFLKAKGQDVKLEEYWTENEYGVRDIKQKLVWKIPLDNLGSVPNFETIRRVRATIQNTEGRLLPTDARVLYDRGFKAEVLTKLFAENPKLQEEYNTIKYAIQ